MTLQTMVEDQAHRDALRAECEEILAALDDLDEGEGPVEAKVTLNACHERINGLLGTDAGERPATSTLERHGL